MSTSTASDGPRSLGESAAAGESSAADHATDLLRADGSVRTRPAAGVDVGAAPTFVRWVTCAGAGIPLLVGAAYLAAWLLGLPPAWAARGALVMKTNTAAALLLGGAALLLLRAGDDTRVRRAAASAASALVLFVGAATLCEHVLRVDLGIDQLLVTEPPGVGRTLSPNRMGPPAAVALTLLGAGLLALTLRRRVFVALGAASACIIFVPAVGFLYGIAPLHDLAHLTIIAWPTVLSILALSVALAFADPRDGSRPVLWRADAGGAAMRSMLLPVVLLPVGVGWIRVVGERDGLYDRYVGSGLFAVTLSVLFFLLLWRGAVRLSASAAERAAAAAELRHSEERARARAAELEAILACVADGVVVYDREGRIVRSNAAADALLGYDARERRMSIGERFATARYAWLTEDGRVLDAERAPAYRAARHGETLRGSVWRLRSAADERWITLSAAPLLVDGARVGAVVSLADTTARKRAEDQVREADRRKNDFLAVLSHELRNPLAPIRNALHILHRAAEGSEQARRARAVIERQVVQLTRLVEDLLDVTRISRGKIALRRSRFDVAALVREAAEDHRPILAAREVALEVRSPRRELWVDADPTRVRQLVGNLLHNAAKFTNAHGHVVVFVEEAAPAWATVRVADDGIGIAPDVLPHLFEPFAQAEQAMHRSLGGLGLGLALVKGLVELHGGRVQARSGGLGRGAEFLVALPLLTGFTASPRPVAPTAPPRGRRLRVLVVEDNLDAAETLKDALELGGHEVAVAHDGHQGTAMARALHPDVVLCDVGLPGLDGYEVARQLRTGGDGPAMVAITGYATPEDQRRAFEAGFDHHLAKPFQFEELEQLLERAAAER